MNRPIKFRAWSTATSTMRSFSLNDDFHVFGWEEVMQFTGLLDKNGVEIYEGDKIQIFKHYSDKNGKPEVEHRGIVIYQNAGYCIEDDGSAKWEAGKYGLGNPAYSFNLEVIGNMYEN